jgi:autotransporter-associated beta strand protein
MKPTLQNPGRFLAPLLLLAGTHAHGAELFWDADGDASADTGGSGPWNLADALWRDGSPAAPATPWTNGSAAVLGGTYGTLAIPAATAIQASRIHVLAGTAGTAPYLINTANATTGTLAFNGPAKTIEVAAGTTLNLGAGTPSDFRIGQVSAAGESNQLRIQGGGTVNFLARNRAYAGSVLATGAGTVVKFTGVNGLDNGTNFTTIPLTAHDGATIEINATNNYRTNMTLGGAGLAGGTFKLGQNNAIATQGAGRAITVSGISKSSIVSTLANTGTAIADFGSINGNNQVRPFNVNPTGDPSGVDLEYSAGFRNGTLAKNNAGAMRLNAGFHVNRANDFTTFAYANASLNVNAGTFVNEGRVLGMTTVGTNGTARTGSSSGSYDAVTVNGNGVLEVSRASGTFTAGLSFDAGQNSITLNNGGTLRYVGVNPDLSPLLNTLNGSGGTVDTNGQDLTFATALTGGGGLTKAGAGTLTLAAPATYAGPTTVTGGSLAVAATGALASTVLDLRDGTTLDLSAIGGIDLDTAGSRVTGGGTATLVGNLALGADGRIEPGGDAQVGTTAITGSFALAGEYRADLGTATSDRIAAGGPADLSGATITPLSTAPFLPGTYTLLTYPTLAGTPTLNVDPQVAASRYNPVLDLGPKSSPGSVTLTLGPVATLAWAGSPAAIWDNNTAGWINGTAADVFKPLDFVTFGDLTAPDDSYGVSIAGEVHTNGMTFTHTAPRTYTLGGAGFATGPGGLALNGGGSVVIDADNTYTGATSITAGTLFLNSAHLGGGAYTVAAAGTLAGNGVTNAAVNLSGTLAPGTAAGTLDILGTGPLALDEGATLALEINTSTIAADLIEVAGNVTRPGTVAKLALSDLGGDIPLLAGTKLTLVDYSGTWNTADVLHFGGSPVPNQSVITLGSNRFLVNYADGGTMTLTAASPFDVWIAGFIGELPLAADRLATADPDNDGFSNLEEHALKGDPADRANNGLVAVAVQDGDSPADTPELTLVAAVFRGATFGATAGNAQQAAVAGITYTVQGSASLSNWTSPVSALPAGSDTAPAASGLTENLAGTDWEYRAFSLDASEGLPDRGFLRIAVSPE